MREVSVRMALVVLLILAFLTSGGGYRAWGAQELKITGSTTFAPLVAALTEPFQAKNPDVKVSFAESNADQSINALLEGEVAVCCSARVIRPAETEKASRKRVNLTCRAVALDSIVPIVHPSNTVRSMGLAQLSAVFEGKIRNWKLFDGGPDLPIRVVSRESGSAMDEFWREKAISRDAHLQGATILRSNQEIVKMIAEDPSAIGYTSFSRLTPQVRVLPLSGIDTSAAPNEFHPLSRKLLMCTNGKTGETAQTFLDFVLSPEGRSIVQKAGFTVR